MDFIELIRSIKNDTDLSKNINSSIYEENIKIIEGVKEIKEKEIWYDTIDECIYNSNDNMISLIPSNEKEFYLKQLVMNICSEIDEKNEKYDDMNYNRSLNKSKVQQGLQGKNNLISILYLSDYYKIHFVFVCDKEYFETSLMNYKKMYIECNKNHYRKIDSLDESYKKKNLFDSLLKLCIQNETNIKNLNIYKIDLKAISSYTLSELIVIGNQLNIKIKENGKNRKKSDIYNDIQIYKIRELCK